MKGGFGFATYYIEDLEVAAAAVVNSFGDVVDSNGRILSGARGRVGDWLVQEHPWRPSQLPGAKMLIGNTTLVVVMTNARLDKIGANLIALRAHDGIAIAVQPTHTTYDGDVSFAVATGQVDVPVDLVGNIAVAAVSEAIRNAVRHARTVSGFPGLAGE